MKKTRESKVRLRFVKNDVTGSKNPLYVVEYCVLREKENFFTKIFGYSFNEIAKFIDYNDLEPKLCRLCCFYDEIPKYRERFKTLGDIQDYEYEHMRNYEKSLEEYNKRHGNYPDIIY